MSRTIIMLVASAAVLQLLTVFADPPSTDRRSATDVKSTQQVDLRGEWEPVLLNRRRGLGPPSDEEAMSLWTIEETTIKRTVVGIPVSMSYTLDRSQSPHKIDLAGIDEDRRIEVKGICLLKRDIMILKVSQPESPRPTSIDFSPDEVGMDYLVLVRVSKPGQSTTPKP